MKNLLLSISFALSAICSFSQNNALNFDGLNDYVNLGSSVNNVRTIEFWFAVNQMIDPSIPDFSAMLCRFNSLQNYNEISISFQKSSLPNPGCIRFNIAETVQNTYSVYSDENIWYPGRWYHVAAVVDPVDGMKLFIDGIKQASTNPYNLAPLATSDPTYLGCWGTYNQRFFNGKLDDVHFATDALYFANFTPPCPDRVLTASSTGLWHMNEGSGNSTADSGTNGIDGVLNGPTWEVATPCLTGIDENGEIARELIKIVDPMGRETEDLPNTELIYIYNDGTIEKKFRME